MVQIKQLINTSILNAEWVGFQGDSEFVDENGELQLGYWNFKSIEDDCIGTPYSLDDDIEEELIYGGVTLRIKNSQGNICIVELHYNPTIDAFDKAFLKCNKEEREQILKLTAEEFAEELCKSFNISKNKKE